MQLSLYRILGLACLTATLSLPGALLAHGWDSDDGPGAHGMMMGGGMGMMGGEYGAMGPGMMGGNSAMMTGPMMGYGEGWSNLSGAQREKLLDLQQNLRKRQLEHMQSMLQQHFNMQKAYLGDTPDKKAILDAQRKINDIHLEMLEEQLDAREKMQAIMHSQP